MHRLSSLPIPLLRGAQGHIRSRAHIVTPDFRSMPVAGKDSVPMKKAAGTLHLDSSLRLPRELSSTSSARVRMNLKVIR